MVSGGEVCYCAGGLEGVMRENGLMVSQKRHKAKRVAKRSKPRADRPRQ